MSIRPSPLRPTGEAGGRAAVPGEQKSIFQGDTTMRFMIIVKATRESEAGVMPENKLIEEMTKYHEELAKAGMLLDASGLQPTSKGWRIRYSGGKRSVVDGPFPETKELIAGYTFFKARSREEAIEWTRKFPNPAHYGADCEIEVRPLFDLDDLEQTEAVQRFRELVADRQE